MKNPTQAQSFLCVFAAVFIWSTSFVATKVALLTFPPLSLAAVRLTLASILLGWVSFHREEFVRPTARDFMKIAGSGLLGITAYFALENFGLKFSSAADGALLVGSFPVITLVLESIMRRNRIPPIRLAGAIIGIVGVYIIVSANLRFFGSRHLMGDVFLVLSGITWAFYNFITRGVVRKYPMLTVNFIQTAAGALAFYPLTLLELGYWHRVSLWPALSIVYLAIFSSVIAYLLYTYGLRQLEASVAVSLMNLIPVFGVIFSVAILHERIFAAQILGGCVVIVGVYLNVQKKTSSIPPPE